MWILLLMHVPTALKADGSMLRGSSALLTEVRRNYSPGIWMNISGGRDSEKNRLTAFENILSHIAEIYSEDRENQPNLFFFPFLYNSTFLELPLFQ